MGTTKAKYEALKTNFDYKSKFVDHANYDSYNYPLSKSAN